MAEYASGVKMATAGLAGFVRLAFLIPVPLLTWLDRPRRRGLALKAVEPKAPTWGLLLGAGFLDPTAQRRP